jgi:hypothetical protein
MTSDLSGVKRWGEVGVRLLENAFQFICSDKEVPESVKKLILEGKGFFDYDQEEWDEVTRKRDKEFLQRLKRFYW